MAEADNDRTAFLDESAIAGPAPPPAKATVAEPDGAAATVDIPVATTVAQSDADATAILPAEVAGSISGPAPAARPSPGAGPPPTAGVSAMTFSDRGHTQADFTGDFTQSDPAMTARGYGPQSDPRLGGAAILARPANSTADYFEWRREFARGGLGAVWLAHDTRIARNVAVKELLPNALRTPGMIERFLAEAQITGQLEHPCIVPIYEVGAKPDGCPFYAMKLLEGRTLSDAIKEHHARPADDPARPLEFDKLLRVFVGVCNAIAFAHKKGVLHRDLKPLNVMVGHFGEAVVVDWGLAKIVGQAEQPLPSAPMADQPASSAPTELLTGVVRTTVGDENSRTIAGSIMGTPAYMSPEQAFGKVEELCPRSDIYSLGAVLYEILVGKAPYSGKNAVEIISAVRKGSFLPPRTVRPEVPKPLEAIVLKAMALSPEGRYDDAQELADEVARWQSGEPVLAYPESRVEQLRRWARKRRGVVAAASIGLLAVTAVSTISAGFILAAKHEVERALSQTAAARDAEAAAKEESLRRGRQTREVVDVLLNGAAEGLQDVPGAETLRRQLLEGAVGTLAKIHAERPGSDPGLQLEGAWAFARLARTRRLLGDADSAKAALEQARPLFASLTENADERVADDARRGLASLDVDAALIARDAGQLPEARRQLESALAQLESIQGDRQQDKANRASLAAVQANLGQLLDRSGESKTAAPLLQAAADHFATMSEAAPDDIFLQQQASVAQNMLGQALGRMGMRNEAARALRQGAAMSGGLAKKMPGAPRFLEAAANSAINLGNELRADGRFDEAEAEYRKAVEKAELLSRVSGSPPRRALLGLACLNLGALLAASERDVGTAENVLSAAIREFDGLSELEPQTPSHKQAAAVARSALALLAANTGRAALGEPLAQAAAAALATLRQQQPESVDIAEAAAVAASIRGQVLARLGRPEGLAAIEAAARDLAALADKHSLPYLRDSHAQALAALGRAQLQAGRKEAAEISFRAARDLWRSLAAGPAAEPVYAERLAWLLARCPVAELRDGPQAATLARAAATARPSNSRWHGTLAAALLESGDWAGAAKAAEEGVRLAPAASVRERLLWAAAARRQGQAAKADELLLAARELRGENPIDHDDMAQLWSEAAAPLGSPAPSKPPEPVKSADPARKP